MAPAVTEPTTADTASVSDVSSSQLAQATFVFGPEPYEVYESETDTSGGAVVVSGSRPDVEQYLARLRVPIAALMEVSPAAPDTAEIRKRFKRLAKVWLRESAHLSSTTKQAMLPSYQQIIGLGPDALPFILQRLEREPEHWFWALRAIAGADPVKPEHVGRVQDMADDWLRWARDKGMLV